MWLQGPHCGWHLYLHAKGGTVFLVQQDSDCYLNFTIYSVFTTMVDAVSRMKGTAAQISYLFQGELATPCASGKLVRENYRLSLRVPSPPPFLVEK